MKSVANHHDSKAFVVQITINGKEYCLNEENGWVTISRYVDLYKIKNVTTILSWISRGIVSEENVVEIPHLNNMKLIRSIEYKPRKYSRTRLS